MAKIDPIIREKVIERQRLLNLEKEIQSMFRCYLHQLWGTENSNEESAIKHEMEINLIGAIRGKI